MPGCIRAPRIYRNFHVAPVLCHAKLACNDMKTMDKQRVPYMSQHQQNKALCDVQMLQPLANHQMGSCKGLQ